MIGVYPVFALLLFIVLPLTGSLLADKHRVSAWLGLLLGLAAWMSLLSGHIISMMIRDWLERNKFPKRQPNGPWLWSVAIVLFGGSLFGTISLYHWISIL